MSLEALSGSRKVGWGRHAAERRIARLLCEKRMKRLSAQAAPLGAAVATPYAATTFFSAGAPPRLPGVAVKKRVADKSASDPARSIFCEWRVGSDGLCPAISASGSKRLERLNVLG